MDTDGASYEDVLKEAQQLGYAETDPTGDVEGFDASYADNLMFLSPFTPTSTDEAIQTFVTSFKDAYGETPNQFAADAYDAVYTIKAAIEKSGATPDMSVSEICDLLKKAMLEISVDGVTGAGITWDADGEPTKAPKAMVIKNGVYEAME